MPRSWRLKSAKAATLPRRSATSEPVGARPDLSLPRLPAIEDVVDQPGAAGFGEELGAEPDQPARGDDVFHPHPAGAVVDHLLHAALAQRQQLRDHADELLGRVDAHPLDRLVELAVDLAGDDLGLADGHLEALTAHHLDQHRQRQLAAALHLPDVGALGHDDPQRDVADELAVQSRLELRGGQLVAVLAGQRRVVDAERDRQRRLVDGDQRQRPGIVGIGERLADRDLGDAGDGDDVARRWPRRR